MTEKDTESMHIISIDTDDDGSLPAGISALLERTIVYTLNEERCPSSEVSVLVTDNAGSQRLNAAYRGMDEPTDVLSFPQDDDGESYVQHGVRLLGDVVINYDRVVSQAWEYGHSNDREWAFLAVHGVLHLLGYDHEHDEEKKIMRAREDALLEGLGLAVTRTVRNEEPSSSMDTDKLLEVALAARNNAYAPYSRFKVGAAVLGASGEMYGGCNVENAAYPASRCAEQTAVQKAISAGERRLLAVAVVADTDDVCTPCGVCRQVLLEFGPDMTVVMANIQGKRETTTLAALLPRAFGPGIRDA